MFNIDLSNIDLDLDSIDMDIVMKDNFFLAKEDLSGKFADLFLEAKTNLEFYYGLVALTDPNDEYRPYIVNIKNQKIQEFFLAKFRFHQEHVLQQFYGQRSNHKGQLLTVVETEGARLKTQQKIADTYPRESSEYKAWQDRIAIMQRTVESAKAKLKVIDFAEKSNWCPPKFEDIKKIAKADNINYSDAQKKYENSMKFTHLLPDWVIDYARYFNIEHRKYANPDVEVNPREYRWVTFAKDTLTKENNEDRHFELMIDALEKYWNQVVVGFKSIEDSYMDVTIKEFAKNFSSEVVTVIHPELSISTGIVPDETMGGFFSKLFKVILSPVALFTTSIQKKILDKTLGKILPSKYYSMIANITEVQARVLSGKLDKKSFQMAVESVKDVAKVVAVVYQKVMLAYISIARSATNKVAGEGTFESFDGHIGGLITSVEVLNQTSIVFIESEGKAKINWVMTFVHAVKVAGAITGGALAVGIAGGMSVAGEKTGLDKTSYGRSVLQAGQAYLSGGMSAVKNVAITQGSMTVADKSGLTKSSLGRTLAKAGTAYAVSDNQTAGEFAKSYGTTQAQAKASQATGKVVGKAVASATGSQVVGDVFKETTAQQMGPTATNQAIDSNPSFSERLKAVATAKATEVAKARAREEIAQKLKEETGVDLDKIEKLYSMKDKSVEDIVEEGKQKYFDSIEKIKDRANADYLKEKAQAETDRFIQKRIDETYKTAEKYGNNFLRYLMWKYGPQHDYDRFIVPNDYLQYQVWIIKPPQRIFTFTYPDNRKKKILLVGTLGLLALGATYTVVS